MRESLKFLRWLALAFLAFRGVSHAEDAYVEGEVLVTFKAGIAETGAKTALGRHSLGLTEHYDRISRQRDRVSGMVRNKSRSTVDLVADLKTDPGVETVEPNYLRHISMVVPNDTEFSKLWALRNTGQTVNAAVGTSGVDTKFLTAWRLARPSIDEVVVGVVDTGVDITHPDLAANIWTNPREIAGNGIDDDGDGYVDDVHGYDFANKTATITDSGEHGTHVAGTIAAAGRNSSGVIGVDYRAKILPLKVSTDGENMTTSAVLTAFNYAIALKQEGVNIVALNASFGGESSSTSERNAVTALRDAGIILCAAAGNDGTNNDNTPGYPASYTVANIIAVAACAQTGALASFSNYGATSVDLAAPGVNIYSTKPLSDGARTTTVTAGATTYAAQELEFSGSTPAAGLTKNLVSCGIGNPADFPAGVAGNIALIQRGTLTFAQKVTNAAAAGAVAAVICDNTASTLAEGGWTLGASGAWLPAYQVTQATGAALSAGSVTLRSVVDPTAAYQFLDGTSMATPHVAGAVAFAAMNFPAETMAQRISRILTHVTPVASLAGKMTTGGMLNLLGIVDTDGDGLPDWWETEHFGNLTQTATGDPDGDGFNNLNEYIAGTAPESTSSRLALGVSSSGTSAALAFPSFQDTRYQIEFSSDLSHWSTLGSVITGTGAPIQVSDPAGTTSSKRFYRLHLLPD